MSDVPMTQVDVYDVISKELLFTYHAWDVPRTNDRIFQDKSYVVIYTKFFTALPDAVDVYVLPA